MQRPIETIEIGGGADVGPETAIKLAAGPASSDPGAIQRQHLELFTARQFREEGGTVYAQTGGHYLSLTEDAWRINVPLRSAEAIEVLWQALADGRIDSVGSDHTNVSKPRKEMEVKGDIWATRTGFPSRGEAHLPVMLNDGVSKGRITLQRLVEVCCENPARNVATSPYGSNESCRTSNHPSAVWHRRSPDETASPARLNSWNG